MADDTSLPAEGREPQGPLEAQELQPVQAPPEPPAPQDGQPPLEPEAPRKEKPSLAMDLYFWTQALVIALVLLILVFTLVGRLIGVKGHSMIPTLHDGDMLLLQSVGYKPKQGDVVVLRKESFMDDPIVKRVIATGGQHVTVDYGAGKVYVDGAALDEPYLNEPMAPSPYLAISDIVVPEGSIFVMGDNRNHSSDSRDSRLGTVDERYVLGRVLCVIFPFSDFGAVK